MRVDLIQCYLFIYLFVYFFVKIIIFGSFSIVLFYFSECFTVKRYGKTSIYHRPVSCKIKRSQVYRVFWYGGIHKCCFSAGAEDEAVVVFYDEYI